MRKFLKYAGYAIGGILLLAVVGVAVMYLVGGRKVDRTYEVQTAALVIPTDSASVAHGRHLAGINGCIHCHGQNLAGQVFADAPPFRVVASNLTSGVGGVGGTYTDVDWDRAVRHGVRPGGTSLFIMPASGFHNIADDDMADLIAYLKRVPPVDNELPATEFHAFGRILSAGPLDPAFEVNLTPTAPTSPPSGPTLEHGAYRARICAYCHGEDLRGMQPPNPAAPPSADLGAAGEWPLDLFIRVLRTGVLPAGRRMNHEEMPWPMTALMTDDELTALHLHLATLGGPAAPATATD